MTLCIEIMQWQRKSYYDMFNNYKTASCAQFLVCTDLSESRQSGCHLQCRHCRPLCRHNADQLSAPDNDGYGVTYATLVSNLNIYKPHYFDNSTL